jgi:hypothetical protein
MMLRVSRRGSRCRVRIVSDDDSEEWLVPSGSRLRWGGGTHEINREQCSPKRRDAIAIQAVARLYAIPSTVCGDVVIVSPSGEAPPLRNSRHVIHSYYNHLDSRMHHNPPTSSWRTSLSIPRVLNTAKEGAFAAK